MSHQPITDLSFIEQGATWPPPSEDWRIKRYKKNRQLWKGMHDEVYGNWWRILREDKAASLEMVFNWHKRLSTLWADLLLSEPPRFYDGDEESGHDKRQEHIDRLSGKDENGYVTTLYEVALDVSRYGDGLTKITLEEDGAAIWAQTPLHWFPVVDPANLRKTTHHVLAWELKRNDTDFLWIEIHEKGRISYRVHKLDGNVLSVPVSVQSFSPGTPNVEITKIKDFLIVPFSGLRASDEIFGVDDYTDLDSMVQALEVRAGLINNILDKHSDPSMYGPDDALERDHNGNPVFKAGGRYFGLEGGTADADVIPGYVTWEGQLESAFKQLEFLIEQLYVVSETSPAAFGQLKAGLAESGSALRRLMQAPLAKVARIRMRFDPAARRALKIAAELERLHGRGTPEITALNIQWEDGLPPDAKEQAETEEIRLRSGTSAQASSIRRLNGGTQEEAEAERERIRDEQEDQAARAIAHDAERARIAGEQSSAEQSSADNDKKKERS